MASCYEPEDEEERAAWGDSTMIHQIFDYGPSRPKWDAASKNDLASVLNDIYADDPEGQAEVLDVARRAKEGARDR